jgi:hypothetical protein
LEDILDDDDVEDAAIQLEDLLPWANVRFLDEAVLFQAVDMGKIKLKHVPAILKKLQVLQVEYRVVK